MSEVAELRPKDTCSMEGCERPRRYKLVCGAHYQLARKEDPAEVLRRKGWKRAWREKEREARQSMLIHEAAAAGLAAPVFREVVVVPAGEEQYELPFYAPVYPDVPTQTPGWQRWASCAGKDPELWFSNTFANRAAGAKICTECSVRVECLQDALGRDEEGIWGGTTRSGRRALRAQGRKNQTLYVNACKVCDVIFMADSHLQRPLCHEHEVPMAEVIEIPLSMDRGAA